MQRVEDTGYPDQEVELIRAFGPNIIKTVIPEHVGYSLIELFENNAKADDHSHNLAGNMKREFQINDKVLNEEDANAFVKMLADGSGELYSLSKRVQWENTRRNATAKHIEIVENRLPNMNLSCTIHQAWGNISVAGDFNPAHTHTGQISGVGYLNLPPAIEQEWATEDHDPSAGCIHFSYGERNNGLGPTVLRLKPEVGKIYFFPAWLQHHVYPFRSEGERWSFSFNTTVTNLTGDLELTDEDKAQMEEARQEAIRNPIPVKGWMKDEADADGFLREQPQKVTELPFDEYIESRNKFIKDKKND
tara:strand:+ start:459 stop:1373 length:915 start_codon:yes stop_codon:yes gene_type:complete